MKIESTRTFNAVRITSHSNDFAKDQDWKEAYFGLLTWKNTWYIPYKMDIESNRSGAYLSMIVRDEGITVENTLEMLTNMGYGNIKTDKITVMEIEPGWNEKIDEYVIG